MLVLTRKPDERVKLYTSDGVITLTIVRVAGQDVRLGIEAGDGVMVVREELETSGGR